MTAHEVSITITAEDRFTAALREAVARVDRFAAAMEHPGRIAPPRDLSAVLADIDMATAPVCAQCDGPLGDSPSDDFCRPNCQERWHALRSVALTNYREPLLDWATLGPQPTDFESPRRPARGHPAGQVIFDELHDAGHGTVTEYVPEHVVRMADEALTRRNPPRYLVWLEGPPVPFEVTRRQLTRWTWEGHTYWQYAYRDDRSGDVVAWGPVMYR